MEERRQGGGLRRARKLMRFPVNVVKRIYHTRIFRVKLSRINHLTITTTIVPVLDKGFDRGDATTGLEAPRRGFVNRQIVF